MELEKLGWCSYFEENFKAFKEKGLTVGKVITKQIDRYTVSHKGSEVHARLTGKFRHNAQFNKDFPTVGDWVVFDIKANSSQATIHAILPRKNGFARKLPISGGRKLKNGIIDGGSTEEQIIASNIDTAFIVSGLDNNFDIRRIERYLTLVYNSGAEPVIILNKMDICSNVADCVSQVKKIAMNAQVFPISVEKGLNMDVFNQYILSGKTVVFLGSSGVGKSTLTNALLGEEKQKMQTISVVTGKGRHTTTSVKLIFHSSGCMMVDTPGLKEIQLWGDEDVLDQSFEDIKEISLKCKFNNCQHDKEPGCSITKAIQNGDINTERFESYKKQLKELQRLGIKKKQFEQRLNNKMKK